ncbi:ATP-binding protein [Kribbella sp. NPDC020789]
MPALNGIDFHRLVQVPAPELAGEAARPSGEEPDRLLAAIAGAHAELLAAGPGSDGQRPILCSAWLKAPGAARMQFLVGGRPGFPPAARPDDELPKGTPRPMLFPPGATAIAVPELEAMSRLESLRYWVPCRGVPDTLWSPDPAKKAAPAVRRGAFERYAAHLGSPYGWLVIAEPLGPEELRPELDRLVAEILPLTRTEVGEAKRIELERKQGRHRELSRAQFGGSWRIHVLVGGDEAGKALSTAATLCSAAELDGLPYVLSPGPRAMPLATALQAADEVAVVAGSDLVVALCRPPEQELPGLRVVDRHTFDLTQEDAVEAAAPPLELGQVLDRTGAEVGPATVSRQTLNRHTFVCGATGAGKSQTVRHLLTEATRNDLRWLAVEPAKAEYARMATRLTGLGAEVIVIRPGDPKVAPAGFNPLEPAKGFPLQTHIDLLRALFLAAFESHEPFPQILSTALVRSYEELGWDLTLSEPVDKRAKPRYPTLGDLQRVAGQVVADIGYGKEAAADVSGFIKVRLSSLRLGTTGRFFEGGHPLQFDQLRRHNVVLEIENVGDDADKAFLMGAVLIQLSEYLRMRDKENAGKSRALDHLTVIEEAHRLLRRTEPGSAGPASKAVEMFASLLAEVRAYGEGLIIAEQIPGKLTPEVIKNTAAKIVHRLPAQDDRDAVGATMNLDEPQSRYVVTLEPGDAAYFTDGMDRPVLIHVPDGTTLEESADVRTAPVDALIKRRSASCGPSCQATACTLREMRTAQHTLQTHSWLTLWAELTVLAHLTGNNTPAIDLNGVPPIDSLLDSQRLFGCAVSHAVDAAIAARSSVLHPAADPELLAIHCCQSMQEVLAGSTSREACGFHGMYFLAEHYRPLEALAVLRTAEPGPVRHPRTAEWEEALGMRLPGDDVAGQTEFLKARWNRIVADQVRCDAVTFGTAYPSTIESVIGGSRNTEGWGELVRRAVEPLGAPWAVGHLIPQVDSEGESDG